MVIFAIDDERFALEQLKEAIIKSKPNAQIYTFVNPEELLKCAKECVPDVAFLDIQMPGVSGIDVAKQLKILHPRVNIIFVTGYDKYMNQAIRLHVSGYLNKPVLEEDVRAEFDNLLNPVTPLQENKLTARCFGNFEVMVNGETLEFERAKTKELLAYLIDRRGARITSGELRTVLWEDAATDNNTRAYLSKLKTDLVKTLKEAGVDDAFGCSFNKYYIIPDLIICDYYEYMNNEPEGIKAYNGEYMTGYAWADIESVRGV